MSEFMYHKDHVFSINRLSGPLDMPPVWVVSREGRTVEGDLVVDTVLTSDIGGCIEQMIQDQGENMAVPRGSAPCSYDKKEEDHLVIQDQLYDIEEKLIELNNNVDRVLTAQYKREEIRWALQEFDNWLRSQTKHQDEEDWPSAADVRYMLWQILDSRNIDLWED